VKVYLQTCHESKSVDLLGFRSHGNSERISVQYDLAIFGKRHARLSFEELKLVGECVRRDCLGRKWQR
jgi:hypothetical protein